MVDLVERLRDVVDFGGRRVLYNWLGATRRDWRGQGHFRALTEQSETWAVALGYEEVVIKSKAAGASEFLVKPVTPKALLTKIETVLKRRMSKSPVL